MPRGVAFRRSLAFAFSKLGTTYQHKGDAARAVDMYEQALELRKQLVIDSPANTSFKNELASTEVDLGPLVMARDAKRGADLLVAGVARARALVQGDPINLDLRETLVEGLLAVGRTSDRAARRAALDEAVSTAEEAARRTPQNVQWPGYVAEGHAGLAELASGAVAISEWKKVRDLLEPLATAGRLPAPRMPLLNLARGHAK